jgi:pyruvate dehydrogenase E1 component alpha subunit
MSEPAEVVGAVEAAERAARAEPAPLPDWVDGEVGARLLHRMLRIRRFEERCVELYSREEIRGFLHLYVGQEAVATGICEVLADDDRVVATYREHGHALSRGISMRAAMAEMLGRVEGCSRGRGGSMHLFDAGRRFYGGNAIVGAGIPLAVGLALGDHLQDHPHLTACFFGEGAVAEGEFHESANLAALWHLPVVLCCENNGYAMGTALDRSEASVDLIRRAAGYGMAAWSVDGMDVVAVAEAARRAVVHVRGGEGPCFLELRTYRFRAHSMYDPERYRDKAEVARWRDRDPVDLLADRLRATGLLDADALERLERSVVDEVDDAVAFAEAGSPEAVDQLERFVHSDGSSVLKGRW